MGQTYTSALFHTIFAIAENNSPIPPSLQPQLWDRIEQIALLHGMKALAVGGTGDHAHVLLSLPASMPVEQAVATIKSASAQWMRDQCSQPRFAWRETYGAFSIGPDQVHAAVVYINRQEEHHRERDYHAEFALFAKKNGMVYDPDYALS